VLAKAGHEVVVLEKNVPLERARQLKGWFTFDMGPSWYWMPDVFDRFADFGKTTDYYEPAKLSPAYRCTSV
jgi:phytoene desaturase